MDTPQRGKLAEEAVVLTLAGLLAVLSLVEARERNVQTACDARGLDRVHAPDASLATWNARELRSLPSIGEKRAVEIVRARWAGRISGDVDSLDRVVGIGPETVERIRAELERREKGRDVQLEHLAPEPVDTTEETRP